MVASPAAGSCSVAQASSGADAVDVLLEAVEPRQFVTGVQQVRPLVHMGEEVGGVCRRGAFCAAGPFQELEGELAQGGEHAVPAVAFDEQGFVDEVLDDVGGVAGGDVGRGAERFGGG